ncbi:MAG: RagB/SusD family nutrient uptake outer membrane protein, partial [Chitinophagaceae bacterium]
TEDASELRIPLQNIYIFNKVINEVPSALNGTDAEKNSLIAEAKAMRAWTYFLLINYYGKPYNAATAASDAGFPIVTDAEVTETNFTRASVQEVYDFILSDLTTSIPSLPPRVTHRIKMSKAAAEGLLGKVYVFMGRFNDALPMLNASINDISGASIPVGLYDYNVTLATGGSFLPISIFGPTYPTVVNNQENIFGKQVSNPYAFIGNELVITPQTVALYGSNDLRLQFYSATPYGGPDYPNGLRRRTAPGAIQFGVVLPDIYLLRAECKVRSNDLSGAVTDLQTLRARRMPAGSAAVPAATASQQISLLRYVMDERIREFALQGFRWYDMRRLSVDPLFSGTVYTHTQYSATGGVSNTYTLTPERLVLRLPQKIIDQNPGMVNNP